MAGGPSRPLDRHTRESEVLVCVSCLALCVDLQGAWPMAGDSPRDSSQCHSSRDSYRVLSCVGETLLVSLHKAFASSSLTGTAPEPQDPSTLTASLAGTAPEPQDPSTLTASLTGTAP